MKDKKIITIFILTAIFILLGIVGFTIAYFTSTTEFENEFESGLFQTEATEVFNSPSNWEPGDTTQKELTIENTGNVNARARVCLSEEWTSLNGDSLPNEVNNERVAILNLANTSDWTKRGNCYIYNDVLEPNDVTSTFINSVTFNPNIEADYTCETTSQSGTIEKTCESTGDGYDGASYTLTFTVETIQASAYEEMWVERIILYGSPFESNFILGSNFDASDPGILSYTQAGALNELYGTGIKYYTKAIAEDGIITKAYIEMVIPDSIVQNDSNMTAGTYSMAAGTTYNERRDFLLDIFGENICVINNDTYICEYDYIIFSLTTTNYLTFNNGTNHCQIGIDYASCQFW